MIYGCPYHKLKIYGVSGTPGNPLNTPLSCPVRQSHVAPTSCYTLSLYTMCWNFFQVKSDSKIKGNLQRRRVTPPPERQSPKLDMISISLVSSAVLRSACHPSLLTTKLRLNLVTFTPLCPPIQGNTSSQFFHCNRLTPIFFFQSYGTKFHLIIIDDRSKCFSSCCSC